MKFIHSADIHLGSRIDSKFPREVSEKKREAVRDTFRRMVEYAKNEGIGVIVLSGDVFDSDKPFKKDKEFFFSVVENNPDIDFLYLRGNHDGVGEQRALPNLKTFGEEWCTYDYGDAVISGIEIVAGNATSLYSSLSLDRERQNVVMLHGQIGDAAGVDKIALPKLRDKSIDYLALGHVHGYATGRIDERGTYVYSGCPEGRGFDETGDKGFVLVEVTNKGVTHEFVPFCALPIRLIELDITDLSDSYAVYLRAVDRIEDTGGIYRFELVGEVEAETADLAQDVKGHLSTRCLFADVKDRTRRKIDMAAYEQDLSLAGEFVRSVWASDAYTEEEKLEIVGFGLRALKGMEVEG